MGEEGAEPADLLSWSAVPPIGAGPGLPMDTRHLRSPEGAVSGAQMLLVERREFRDRLGDGLGSVVQAHLAHVMLVQVLRQFMVASSELPKGWFLALTDRQISPAIGAMHAEPARHWTLEELARVAGVSRTVFAQRFKALVGSTAMDYLTRWRMLLAADRLRTGSESVASIAFSLGYESESSFSTAFKRVMSCPPTQYRRQSVSPVTDTSHRSSAPKHPITGWNKSPASLPG
ncbi:MAG: helix-turn-helix transcriptional regulator [Burkholderiales bacterium]|nr:helix-turn-helix transcriptional regulator [Burkholderiales bacterium]